jgi:hypothetical protein
MSAVTVTSPTVLTVAMRTPAMIAGIARGSSTRSRSRVCVYPIPVAASFTSGGTPSRPVTVFRTRMSSVYATSGTSAVVRLRKPVMGPRITNSASDGIV